MKQALLIIDVQNDYFAGGKCELHQPEIALTEIKKLQKWFREKCLPIYYVQHLSLEGAEFFVPNTEGAELSEALKLCSTEKVIRKHYPNSFLKTELQTVLNENGITDLIICGMMTHMCVDTTVRAANDYGYRVTLISNACATKSLYWDGEEIPANVVQKAFMAAMNKKFADVMTAEQFLSVRA